MNRRALLISVLFIVMSVSRADADTGWISDGGSVHLLGENGSVSMESEVVNIRVSKNLVEADCLFKFVNNGPACTVRMGFPDQCSDERDSDDGSPKGAFLSYKSFIDGKEVKTETLKGGWDNGAYTVWHANDVSFDANGRREIRNTYTVCPGFAAVSEKGYAAKCVAYTLHTASSWRGKIHDGVVSFNFDGDVIPLPVELVEEKNSADDKSARYDWQRAKPGTLVFTSALSPVVEGNSIQFKFKNFRPSTKDDIFIFYGRMGKGEATRFVRMVEKTYAKSK